jgi:hypothetical protein
MQKYDFLPQIRRRCFLFAFLRYFCFVNPNTPHDFQETPSIFGRDLVGFDLDGGSDRCLLAAMRQDVSGKQPNRFGRCLF